MRIFLILALHIAMYARTLGYGVIIDDEAALERAATARHTHPLVDIWKQIRGDYISDARFAHLLSMIVHGINCVLIYLAFGQTDISFLAALLFCVNPVNNQVSIWISGRAYGVATMMVLLGFWLHQAFPAFYFLSFYWSINAIVAPLVYLVVHPSWQVVLVAPLIAYLMRRQYMVTFTDRRKTVPARMGKFNPGKLVLVFKTIAYYTFLCLVPDRVGMCHSYLHTFGLTDEETKPWYKPDKFFYTGIALVAALIAGVVVLPKTMMFGAIWFAVFLAQWCNFIVINHPVAERYAYMANVGLMLFIAQFLAGTPLAYIAVTAYAARLWYFMPAYKNQESFWKTNIDHFPNVAMAYNQYGLSLHKSGKMGTEYDSFMQGLKYREHDFRLNYNMSGLLAASKRFDIIKGFIERAEANIDPINNPDMWRKNIDSIKKFCKENGVKFGTNGTEKAEVSNVDDIPQPSERSKETSNA